MKYWVYINDKVDGPYDGEKLVTLQGFTPETLICSEESASNGSQEWVKASSVFEFEQEPEPQAQQDQSAEMNAFTALLLEKLETLTREVSGLHSKLDSVEHHIESMDTKLTVPPPAPQSVKEAPVAQPVAQETQTQAPAEQTAPAQEPAAQAQATATPEPAAQEKPAQAESAPSPVPAETEEDLNEKLDSEEDELVIRSALDSLYNAKLIEEQQDQNETTFQDLLTPEQAQELNAQEEQKAQAQEETPVQEATEENNEAGKEALLAELTTPASNADALDQLIQEKQAENQLAPQEESAAEPFQLEPLAGNDTAHETSGEAPITNDFALQEEKIVDLTLPSETEAVPTLKEKETPAPEAENKLAEEPADQPAEVSSDITPMGGKEGAAEAEENTETENTLQELVPGAENTANDQIVSAEDLKNAFNNRPVSIEEGLVAPEVAEADIAEQANANPNDLTEVELKAGSTYLISDFVPPAQAEAVAKENTTTQIEPTVLDKTAEVQDMLAEQQVPTAEQLAQTPSEEIEIRSTKRGASFDIKTVPMVAEPAESDRLHVEGLDDVNAQHDLQVTGQKASNLTKIIITSLVSLALLIILYVLLAFMNLLPKQYNILAAKEKAVPAAQANEMLMTEVDTEAPLAQEEEAPIAGPLDEILTDAQQFMLPNGQTLKAYVETVHATIDPELITWEITEAVEPDNYSILVKVPPEDPQGFKTSYRFNYNAATRALDPTISDSKNLLDGANVQEVVAQ